MKTYGKWIAVLIVILSANCRKPANPLVEKPGGLTGRWKYAAYFYSIGPPGEWHTVAPGQWIELRDDGSFSSNASPFSAAYAYSIKDSVQVNLLRGVGRDPLQYRYLLKGDTLELAPVPFCIEGCADRFIKE